MTFGKIVSGLRTAIGKHSKPSSKSEHPEDIPCVTGEEFHLSASKELSHLKSPTAEKAEVHYSQLSALIKYCPFGVGMFDQKMNFIAASDELIRNYNLNAETLMGRNLYEIFPETPDYWKELHRRCLAGEVHKRDEDPVLRDSGKLEWLRWHLKPWHHEDGTIGGLLMFIENITSRKMQEERRVRQAQEAAKEIEHLKLALDQSSIVAFTDAAGKITYVNEKFCEISQYTRDELIGKNHRIVNSGYHTREFFSELWKKISSGKVWSGEIQNRAKDGSFYWVFTTIIPFLNENGMPYQYVAIRTDITQQKKLAEENLRMEMSVRAAQEASKLKSEFLAIMSHEIRTPINGVIGLAHLLLDSPLSDEQLDLTKSIQSSADSLLSVINNILDFSKIEAGRMELEKIPFSMAQLLAEIEKSYRYLAELKGLQLVVQAEFEPKQLVKGDSGKIRQVLNNLLANALKFTSTGTVEIKVASLAMGDRIRFEFQVSDSGIGVAPEVSERIFQPFSQADASMTRQFGGTGLGLSISKKLVDLMGGRIGFSNNQGRGSTFWFELDLLAVHGESACLPAASEFRKIPNQPRVLVAEDNLMNQKVTLAMLSRMGAQAEAVGDGEEAFRILHEKPFDLVLMDCQMPILDGYHAAKKIRASQDPRVRELPILAVTAHAVSGEREKCLGFGMNDYLVKPIYPNTLYSALKNWLGREPSRRIEEVQKEEENEEVVSIRKLRALYAEEHLPKSQLFVELVEMFKASGPEYFTAMNEAVQKDDYVALGHLAHQLKSSAASLGGSQMSGTCAKLEVACATSRVATCRELLRGLESSYGEMLKRLDQILTLQEDHSAPTVQISMKKGPTSL